MKVRVTRIIDVVALMGFLVLAIVVIPTFFDPRFEIVNNASVPVSVTATWRDSEKVIGVIAPGGMTTFSVDDEAAMAFTVSYADGRAVTSEPIYFTKGVEVVAVISDKGLDVRYAFETVPLTSIDGQ